MRAVQWEKNMLPNRDEQGLGVKPCFHATSTVRVYDRTKPPTMLLHRVVLLLLIATVVAQPLSARIYVECADGTPCVEPEIAPKPDNDCCHAKHCDEPQPIPDKRCIVNATKPVDMTVQAVSTLHLELLPSAVVPVAVLVPSPVKTGLTVIVADESPPPAVLATINHGPRAPPVSGL